MGGLGPGRATPGSISRQLRLDEGFPSPPGFRAAPVDATVEAVALGQFDQTLAGSSTPHWYGYLRAQEAGFDALVTSPTTSAPPASKSGNEHAGVIEDELSSRDGLDVQESQRVRADLDLGWKILGPPAGR